MRLLLTSIFTVAIAVPLSAQIQQPAPNAPLPAQLTTSKKLFVGNSGDQENADCLRAYNDFYQGVTTLNRFQLVTDPKDAELILELHYEIDLGSSIVSDHSKNSVRQFRLVIIDPITHATLWSLTERTNYAVFQKNRTKDLDQSVDQLVADFNSLTGTQPMPPNNKSRVYH